MMKPRRLARILVPTLIIAGTIFQGVAMFRTGGIYEGALKYWGPLARDGVWHEALTGQIARGIPPQNPGFAGALLTNYHYFYDLFVAILAKLTFLPARTIIYLLLPFLFSIALGQGVYYFARKLFKSNLAGIFALFFIYFGSSFGWVLGLLRGQEIGGESAFWANQPVSMNLNPPFALSLLLLLGVLISLSSYLKKPNKKLGFLIIMLTGICIGVKVYAGLIILAGLFGLSVYSYFRDNSLKLMIVFLGSLLLSSLVFFVITKSSGGLIKFQPLWLIDTMIDVGDRVGIPNLASRRFTYLAEHKWLHYGVVEMLALGIFFVGNLGTRVVGLLAFRKKMFADKLNIFLFCAMVASIVPPLFFVQKGNAWNIVQFFYYFLFFAGLYAGAALASIWNTKRVYLKALVVVILVITPISSAATFRGWLYPNSPAYLPAKELEALSFLSGEPDGTILVHPFNPSLRGNYKDPYPLVVYADSAYVSAFSMKASYLEDIEQQIILAVDYTDRHSKADKFFTTTDIEWSNKFLVDVDIDYVYVPKVYSLPAAEGEYNMHKIFENSEVNIYKVN